ncbi:MAG: hypothetical protein E7596_06995 [Ruminococcaceae bacterium]|nr:hypothetical protein [Oscillospiraceae bacterium]
MKKLISLILCVLTVFMLVGCGNEEPQQETYLKFGKKYIYEYEENDEHDEYYEKNTLIFNQDKTGKLDGYEKREDLEYDGRYSYVKSYTIEFKWRWADTDKSAVYIFETERIYHDDDTEGKHASISNLPFIIGEDLVSLTGGHTYILEGSDIFGVENELNQREK